MRRRILGRVSVGGDLSPKRHFLKDRLLPNPLHSFTSFPIIYSAIYHEKAWFVKQVC